MSIDMLDLISYALIGLLALVVLAAVWALIRWLR